MGLKETIDHLDLSEVEWRVTITLELPAAAGVVDDVQDLATEVVNQPTIYMRVSLPEAYPDVAPDLDLSFPPDAPRIPHFDLANDKPALLSSLQSTVEENLGIQMIFTLLTTLKEAIETLIFERIKAGETAREEEALKAEAEENRKFEGERVTRERFLMWRDKFQREMQEREERRKEEERQEMVKKLGAKTVRDEEKKLTGKELWVRGIAKGDDEDLDGLVEGQGGVKIA